MRRQTTTDGSDESIISRTIPSRRNFLRSVAGASAAGMAVSAASGNVAAGGKGKDGCDCNDLDIQILNVTFSIDGNSITVEDSGNNFLSFNEIDVDIKNVQVKNIDIIDENTLNVNVGNINVDKIKLKLIGKYKDKEYKDKDVFKLN